MSASHPRPNARHFDSIKEKHASNLEVSFDPIVASQALAQALKYLQRRLKWSGRKIASILNLPASTVNNWLDSDSVPITQPIKPDIQLVIHLIAIHRNLEGMFENPENQISWLTSHHPTLHTSPEKLMGKSIEGLIYVRQYLDYVRERGA